MGNWSRLGGASQAEAQNSPKHSRATSGVVFSHTRVNSSQVWFNAFIISMNTRAVLNIGLLIMVFPLMLR